MTATRREQAHEAAADVAAFLRAHPGFLADHPDLYRVLLPPRRVHGEALADHMAAMVQAERQRSAQMAERADGVLAAGRAAAGLAARVQEAVLVLMRAADAAACITHELPALLAIDAAALCAESARRGAHRLPPGAVDALLGGRDVVFREAPDHVAMLYGEAAALARRDALVRVPAQDAAGPALLALGCRDGGPLDRAQGSGALAFLGRAAGAALARTA